MSTAGKDILSLHNSTRDFFGSLRAFVTSLTLTYILRVIVPIMSTDEFGVYSTNTILIVDLTLFSL